MLWFQDLNGVSEIPKQYRWTKKLLPTSCSTYVNVALDRMQLLRKGLTECGHAKAEVLQTRLVQMAIDEWVPIVKQVPFYFYYLFQNANIHFFFNWKMLELPPNFWIALFKFSLQHFYIFLLFITLFSENIIFHLVKYHWLRERNEKSKEVQKKWLIEEREIQFQDWEFQT